MDLVQYIFHEQQEGNLCAQHCLNALLQGPYFTAIDLAELARQLDQKEQDALGNSGPGSRATKSQNMDDSGFFSVQVLSHALSIWNVQIIPWGAKEVSDAKTEPEREVAFICNLEQHWYTLRRFGPSTQRWYDLNSLHPRPKHMSATYLGMTLSQLEAEGYSIFVVRALGQNDSTISAETADATAKEKHQIKPAQKTSEAVASSEDTRATTAVPSSSSSSSTASGFLSERQEMERIRRQRIEERERAAAGSIATTAESAVSSLDNSLNNNKRAHVDSLGQDTGDEKRRLSTSSLVTTPSFLPRCEADDIAATIPLESTQQQAQDQTFGGAGYRLGGTEIADQIPLASEFSLEDARIGGADGDGDEEAEWEMMQQAIAMSLQGAK
ncbi:Ataxin-3 [Haplosporangium sp. Z 767]|nr:Ataxin-3 [Haplosporangium sp. Z 767]KAF9189210.1 Ataxin-3 [Haplosporangium sp. Z 11]